MQVGIGISPFLFTIHDMADDHISDTHLASATREEKVEIFLDELKAKGVGRKQIHMDAKSYYNKTLTLLNTY